MNPLITGSVLAALLMPLSPPAPNAGPIPGPTSGPNQAPRRISVAHGWPEPSRPAAVWPLEPRPEVVAGFDPPSVRWSAGHRGVDLAGRPGTPVRAAVRGTVTFAGTIAGRGVVVVGHGAFRTTYEPVRPGLRRGVHVDAGTVIGTLQAGRSHCAPRSCLHWGLLEGAVYRDPLTLLRRTQVRLLPLEDDPQARG